MNRLNKLWYICVMDYNTMWLLGNETSGTGLVAQAIGVLCS